MPGRTNWYLGKQVTAKGYFTVFRSFRGLAGRDIAAAAGYRPWRFAKGWALLAICEPPPPPSFELRGTSWYPDGIVGKGTRFEETLKGRDYDVVMDQRTLWYHRFARGGDDRVVKAIPAEPDLKVDGEYPRGTGIPQFRLLREQTFVVAGIFEATERCPTFLSAR